MAQTPVARVARLQLLDLLLFIAMLLAAMHWFALPKISLTSIKNIQGTYRGLLPAHIHIKNEDSGAHTYALTIHYAPPQQALFRLYPQNCLSRITLNGFPVAFPLSQKCNFKKGVLINLKHKLMRGDNQLYVQTKGAGFSIGPVIFSGTLALSDILGYLLVAFSCMALARLVQSLTGEPGTGIIMAGGWLLCLYVLAQTTFMWKKYDMPQHLEYITYIANHLRWPSTYDGFLTYHPPLYYTVQAAIMRMTNMLGSFDVICSLRLFNVLCYMTSLIFAALSLRRLVAHRLAYYACLLLLVFYPGGIIASGRIDSDLLFYPLFTGCLYFLLRWIELRHYRELALALGLCGMGLATRTNALVLLPLIALAALYYGRRNGWTLLWSHRLHAVIWVGLFILLLGGLINFGRPAYYNLLEHRDQPYLVANAEHLASIAGTLRIVNNWDSYLTFSLKDYLYPPFFSVWSDRGGRYFFWDSIMKSSMYGEFAYPNSWIAYDLNCLLLGFVFYILASMVMNARRLHGQPQWLILVLTLFVPISGLAANRILNPLACSQDFRYVYPAIAAFCGLMGFAIQQHLLQRRWLFAGAGLAGIASFTGLSLLFFMRMF